MVVGAGWWPTFQGDTVLQGLKPTLEGLGVVRVAGGRPWKGVFAGVVGSNDGD